MYRAVEEFLVRIPVISYEFLKSIGSSFRDPELTVDLALNDPVIREAILSSSPTLIDSAIKMNDGDVGDPKYKASIALSIAQFIIRMTTRPTPFAAFAAVGIGTLSEDRKIEISFQGQSCMHPLARIDYAFLLNTIKECLSDDNIRQNSSFLLNTTAYKRGERMIIPYNDPFGEKKAYTASSIRYTAALEAISSQTKSGEFIHYDSLVDILLELSPNTPLKKLKSFLDNLYAQNFLLSTIIPPVTSTQPLDWTITQLSKIPQASNVTGTLSLLRDEIDKYNQCSLGNGIEKLETLYKLTDTAQGEKQNKIIIDTRLELTRSSFPKEITNRIGDAAEILLRCSALNQDNLAEYRSEFINKYSDGFVPILELLDDEIGLGAPATYAFPKSKKNRGFSNRLADQREAVLMRLVSEAINQNSSEIDLSNEDIDSMQRGTDWTKAAPTSFDIFATIAAPDKSAILSGNYTTVIGPRATVSPAGSAMTRFAYFEDGFDKKLKALAKKEATSEDVMYADILYSHPRAHATNIMVRPSLYKHQIAVNMPPSVDRNNVIDISDIAICVRDGKLESWSISKEKRIVARNLHLVNNNSAPNVCRLLDEIGKGGNLDPLPFYWGRLSHLPFLPRVKAKGIVIGLATWNITKSVCKSMLEDWPDSFKSWCTDWRVPKTVYIGNDDQRLLLKLSEEFSLRYIRKKLTKTAVSGNPLTFTEVLPSLEDNWLTDQKGKRYISEFVFSFVKEDNDMGERQYPHTQLAKPRVYSRDEVLRPFGSEWLYLKLYIGESLKYDVIRKLIDLTPLLNTFSDSWFYICYQDPDYHLRLRCKGDPETLTTKLLPQLTEILNMWTQNGLLTKVSIDSYERELHRYGGPELISFAEDIFHLDSQIIVRLCILAESEQAEVADLAMISTDFLVSALGFDQAERLKLYQHLCQSQLDLYGQNTNPQNEFREKRKTFWSLYADRDILKIVTPFREEVLSITSTVNNDVTAQNTKKLKDLAASLIHMHCNRFGLKRSAENALLHHLYKLYRGYEHYVPEGTQIP